MRILVYTTQVRFPGGYESLALSLAESLVALGVPAFLLSHHPANFAIPSDSCPQREIPTGVATHYLNMPTSPSLGHVIRGALRLRKLVRQLKVDAIEVSGFGPSMLAAMATLGMRVRVLVGVHAVASSTRAVNAKWLAWQLVRCCGARVSFYGVSQMAAEAWLRYIGCTRDRVATVYNSVTGPIASRDPQTVQRFRDELGCMTEDRIVLCVGRILVAKGQLTVVDALLPILATHKLRLVFLGRSDVVPGDDDERVRRMRNCVEASPLCGRVHFLGARQDVDVIMSAAHALAHVPLQEAFGLVLAEAMTVGLPIVASNVGGIPEVVAGTDTILVPPEDPLALRNAFLECLGWSDERRAECIRKGRERAIAFHPDRRADAILALLQGSRH